MRHSLVTGKTAIFEICPENPVLDYEQTVFFLVYTKWCWWWFFNTIFCIHKISSQCYKMKLYQHSWIYHSHLRFRLTLRDIHRWFAKLERAATSVARSTTLPGCGWHHNVFLEVIKIPKSKATAFQTLDSAVYSFNRTVGEIILDAVKTSCTMWKRSMMIRAFGNNALMNLMYWEFRSTTTDFTAALSRFV